MSVDVDWEYEDITLERVCFPEFRTSAPRTHAPPRELLSRTSAPGLTLTLTSVILNPRHHLTLTTITVQGLAWKGFFCIRVDECERNSGRTRVQNWTDKDKSTASSANCYIEQWRILTLCRNWIFCPKRTSN